ncbi:MAG: YdcF family protein [Geminicoccaceae bacterium]
MFYYASKVLWVLAQPSNLLLVLVVGSALALLLGRRRLAAWLLYPAALALLVVGLMPVGQWLTLPLENRFPALAEPPDDIDGVIVLGGAVDLAVAESRGLVAFKENAERNIALVELAERYPDAKLVFTGGSGGMLGTGISEADVMREFARRHGLDGRVIFEDQARNTYQNAVLSKPLAAPAPEQRWLLVTSASHMPRSVGVFRQVGWRVIAYPVDFRTSDEVGFMQGPDAARRWTEFDQAIKSWVGLAAYWLTGRTSALFPAP